MSPKTKDVIVHDGKITVQGWAYSGNGNWVEYHLKRRYRLHIIRETRTSSRCGHGQLVVK